MHDYPLHDTKTNHSAPYSPGHRSANEQPRHAKGDGTGLSSGARMDANGSAASAIQVLIPSDHAVVCAVHCLDGSIVAAVQAIETREAVLLVVRPDEEESGKRLYVTLVVPVVAGLVVEVVGSGSTPTMNIDDNLIRCHNWEGVGRFGQLAHVFCRSAHSGLASQHRRDCAPAHSQRGGQQPGPKNMGVRVLQGKNLSGPERRCVCLLSGPNDAHLIFLLLLCCFC
jgi:hypothetical protein